MQVFLVIFSFLSRVRSIYYIAAAAMLVGFYVGGSVFSGSALLVSSTKELSTAKLGVGADRLCISGAGLGSESLLGDLAKVGGQAVVGTVVSEAVDAVFPSSEDAYASTTPSMLFEAKIDGSGKVVLSSLLDCLHFVVGQIGELGDDRKQHIGDNMHLDPQGDFLHRTGSAKNFSTFTSLGIIDYPDLYFEISLKFDERAGLYKMSIPLVYVSEAFQDDEHYTRTFDATLLIEDFANGAEAVGSRRRIIHPFQFTVAKSNGGRLLTAVDVNSGWVSLPLRDAYEDIARSKELVSGDKFEFYPANVSIVINSTSDGYWLNALARRSASRLKDYLDVYGEEAVKQLAK